MNIPIIPLQLIKANKPAMNNTAVQHVSKHFDIVLGIDFHWTVFPFIPSFSIIPFPLPHPFVGIVFDPVDYLRFNIPVPSFLQGMLGTESIPMGGSIFVHGRHKATTTTSVMGVLLPFRHITSIPVYFIVNIPGSPHEGEVYWGSKTVLGQGAEMSGSEPQQVLTCWCPPMGLKPLPTVPGKIKKNPLAYFAFYSDLLSMYVQINTGNPVLIGGEFIPHKYTPGELLMRFAAIGIMRGLTKIGGKALKGLNQMLQNMFGKNNPLSKLLCHFGLEPVNFVTGAMFFEWTDFELEGGRKLEWRSTWRSDKPFSGMLGNGVYNNYDLYIYPDEKAGIAGFNHPAENMVMPVQVIAPGSGRHYDREQRLWQERPDEESWIITLGADRYEYRRFREEEFGSIYRISRISYKEGVMLTFRYDTGGKRAMMQEIEDDSGRKLVVQPTADGRYIQTVHFCYGDTDDLLVRYQYDEKGNLTHVYDRAGKSLRFGYDQENRVIKRRNRNGMEYSWRYDEHGRVVHTEGEGGFMRGEIRYHPKEGYNEVIYRKDKIEQYWYDESQQVYKKVDALGGETWYEYNRYNEQTMVSSPEGRVSGREYDQMGNITTWHLPDGEQEHAAYDEAGRMISFTDAAGNKESWTYDELGRLETHRQKDGQLITYTYKGGTRKPAAATDGHEVEVRWQYNAFHQVVLSESGEGLRKRWEYDSYGRLKVYDADGGSETKWIRDELGRVNKLQVKGSRDLEIRYDAYDLPVFVSDGREEWQLNYTPMGKVKTQVRKSKNGADTQALKFTYDSWDNLSAVVNEKNEAYRFDLDACDRVIKETHFDGQEEHFRLNADGQVVQKSFADGAVSYHSYDQGGRLVYTRFDDGTYEAFQYDKNGLLVLAENENSTVNIKRDAFGRVTEEDQNGHKVRYRYDAGGNLQTLNTSLGASVRYQYDPLGFLKDMSGSLPGMDTWQAAISRDKFGREIARNSGNVRQVQEYDPVGRPSLQRVEAGGTLQTYRQYNWAGSDKLLAVLNNVTGSRTDYRYDTFGSLFAASYSDDAVVQYKAPDETGNLYRRADRTDRRYGPGGKLLKDDQWYYQYDARGNLIQKSKRNINGLIGAKRNEPVREGPAGLFDTTVSWKTVLPGMATDQQVSGLDDSEPSNPGWQPGDWSYSWDANGMLQAVKNPQGELIRFEYDALGRRTAKISANRIRRFVWEGNVLLHEWEYALAERRGAGVSASGKLEAGAEPVENLITWLYDQSNYTPVARLQDGRRYTIVSDYLGTPTEAYDENGRKVWSCELDIYGKVRKLTGDRGFIPFRYQGQYEDAETGLYYNRFRYYDPESGLYISKDPIGLDGGVKLYSHVEDTCRQLDIFGMEETPWHQMAAKNLDWTPHNNKHVSPPINKADWPAIVKSTKTGPAKYLPGTDIEALERSKWDEGTPVTNGKTWKVFDFGEEVIGASEGREATKMRIEMSANTIHGHPISDAEFRKLTKIAKTKKGKYK
ncbi:RHS repeat-associated core domain-containing protein [Pedobacter sp. SYP-B3415]|uniref:RHS repeat-associated core domain-containing protein n=1 Tax=Pedobacter sp. SYP-B3415 TaxID=2496641 RepID=UPI00101B9018|nr:RHS repeat-associated core domain-containing protein [Pedobacter sp. SYP-B3415]